MLNKKIKIVVLILMFFVICINSNKVNAVSISEIEYSQEYKEWLELSEEEKQKIVAPKMFDLDTNISENNVFTKIKTLMNSILNPRYDLRDKILNNLKIRNQGDTNACWAFATLSSLETNLAIQDNSKVYDFSESHMDYSTSQNFKDGKIENGFSRDVAIGGNFQIGSAYLTSGDGAILENEMPFIDTKENISIANIKNKQVMTKVTDTDEFYFTKYIENAEISSVELNALMIKMKEHIKESGSISAGIHGANLSSKCYNNETGAIYCKNEFLCKMDHNVSIIGWDDNYSRDNFAETNKPNRNGAWIIRNSWGEETNGLEIGDKGFMYVSYEDVNIYKQLFGIEKASENIDYDNIYQYNKLGYNNALNLSLNKIYIANVFDRDTTKNEVLTEVALNVLQKVKCTVYVNSKNDSKSINNLNKIKLKEEEIFDAGYHTLEFKEPVNLTGEKFVVIIEVEAIDDDNLYCTVLSKTTNSFWDNVELKEKTNYITYGEFFEKNMWIDTVTDAGSINSTPSNLTIKAFTQETEIKPTVTPESTIKPTVTPTVTPESTIKPTATPTVTPEPTIKPTATPTITPEPTIKPTATATPTVTQEPTIKPTATPTITPEPTIKPTVTPTISNNKIVSGINSNNNNGGVTTTTQHSSLPYVGKTQIILFLIVLLLINIVIVYRKYRKIY